MVLTLTFSFVIINTSDRRCYVWERTSNWKKWNIRKEEESTQCCHSEGHKGRHFFIVSVGGEWPAAYVEAKPGDPDDYSLFDEMLEGKEYPHGGLSYGQGNLLRLKKSLEGQGVSDEILKLKYWGWDFCGN